MNIRAGLAAYAIVWTTAFSGPRPAIPLAPADSASIPPLSHSTDSTNAVASSAEIAQGGAPQAELRPSLTLYTPQPQHPKNLWIFNRKTLALGSTLAFSIPIVMLEYQWWWREDYQYKRHTFRVENDGTFSNYSLGVDKLGHFYTSYLYFRTFYDMMRWADYSESASLWTAFAVPAAHAISVELCDGFAKYGFSYYDLTANFLGIGYGYAQTRIPFLQNFNVKWSFYPTSAWNRLDSDHGFSHDYSGHTYWLSVNMKNVLPEPVAQYWPKYLNLAVGYGAKNVSFGEDYRQARHKFAISLDYNLSALPIADDTWAMLVRFIDRFHYPAPGIKIYSGGETKAEPLLLY